MRFMRNLERTSCILEWTLSNKMKSLTTCASLCFRLYIFGIISPLLFISWTRKNNAHEPYEHELDRNL